MWEFMGNTTLVSLEAWPKYDESKTVDDTVKIAVQVNGKLKATIDISKNISKDDAIATAKNEPKVAEFIAGKDIVKEIYVPGKIVNIVIK
jgi:leucyl-tRNA synthetase